MAEHNAPITHIAFQRADGTTGVLDIHDESSMHDAPDVVKAENITDGAVGNGKIAPKSVTEAELADGSVTTAVIADGAVTIGKLSPEMQESWDSISQNAICTPGLANWQQVRSIYYAGEGAMVIETADGTKRTCQTSYYPG